MSLTFINSLVTRDLIKIADFGLTRLHLEPPWTYVIWFHKITEQRWVALWCKFTSLMVHYVWQCIVPLKSYWNLCYTLMQLVKNNSCCLSFTLRSWHFVLSFLFSSRFFYSKSEVILFQTLLLQDMQAVIFVEFCAVSTCPLWKVKVHTKQVLRASCAFMKFLIPQLPCWYWIQNYV